MGYLFAALAALAGGIKGYCGKKTSGLSPLENVPFDDEDFDLIRERWHSYERKLQNEE